MSQLYREGDFFSVPLIHGGYAVGLLARQPRRGTLLLGYFFGPRRTTAEMSSGLETLRPGNAQLVCRFKDSGLHRGLWRVFSAVTPWNREDWPVPPFVRKEGLSGRGIRVEYADDNLMMPAREADASVTEMHLADDTVFDEQRIAEALERLLNEQKFTATFDPSHWAGS